MKRPLIAIIPDYKLGGKETYSKKPFYAVRQNYLSSISKAGGVGLILPYDYQTIDQYLDLVDGLLFIGGGFDVNPKRYGEEIHPKTTLNQVREDFEFEVFNRCLKQKPEMPILGICNGMQLINIIFGGSCIQHIPDHSQYLNHEQSKDPEFLEPQRAYHQVIIFPNTKLSKIITYDKISTNSSHHQAIGRLGKDIVISAKATDGIIEAIEHKQHKFCLGVQWHPEFESNSLDENIFKSLIDNCKSN